MGSHFFLVLSDGFYYCSKSNELLVSELADVSINDDVNFKFGSRTMSGKVLFKSGMFLRVLHYLI